MECPNDYKHFTKLLQSCGFDVELANWDEVYKTKEVKDGEEQIC